MNATVACRPRFATCFRARPFSTCSLLSLLLASFLVSGCAAGAVATPEPVTLTIAGSTEMRPVLVELSAEFSRRRPNVLFSLRGGGSALGERWVAEGRVDLAASTLEGAYDPEHDGLVQVPIGLDGLAVIVHRSNTIPGLTMLQLRNLYSGRVLDWQDVGGAPGDVLLTSREDGSGARDLFEKLVMGREQVALTAVVMPTSGDVVEYVADNPTAIGYVSRAYILSALDEDPEREGEPDAGVPGPGVDDDHQAPEQSLPVKVVSVEGVLPLRSDVAEQRYPLVHPLYLLRRTQNMDAQAFIDFALSPAGQEIIGRFHAPIRGR